MKVETVAQVIYDLCSDRSKSSKQVAQELVTKLGFVPAKMEDVVGDILIARNALVQ